MPSNRVVLPGSHHAASVQMQSVGRVPWGQPITVSLHLKSRPQAPLDAEQPMTRETLRQLREVSHADDLQAAKAFAAAEGLEIVEQDPACRVVKLRGDARKLEQAFGTELHHYEAANGAVYRGREGALHVPAELRDRIVSVLGLDTTPMATPKIVPHRAGTAPGTW